MKALKLSVVVLFLSLMGLSGCKVAEEECLLTGIVNEKTGSSTYDSEPYSITIDVDAIPDNDNEVKTIYGTWQGTGIHYSMDITGIEPGMYYVYLSFDFVDCYYGGDPNPWDVPDEANALITCGAVLNFTAYD